MDTQQITQVLSTNNITKNAYLGTFPCDKLPTKIDRIPFAVVVNTDVHTKPGTHWTAIYLPSVKEPIEYFDSYGGEPTNKYIVKFLKMVDQYSYNSRRVQHLFSTACGQHCIYFISNRCKGMSYNNIMNTYNHEGYSKNDKMVKEFCKRKFGLDISKKVSEDFLTRQISRQLIDSLQ